MTQRTSLLRQQLERAMTPSTTPWLIALGICASQPITPIFAADNQYQWSCSASGGSWHCEQQPSNSVPYNRPAHSTPTVASGTAKITTSSSAAEIDWVEENSLTTQQRKELPPGCCGLYQEPARTDTEARLSPDLAPMRAEADQSEWFQETTTILTGNVELTNGYRQLRADKASIDQVNNHAILEGHIQLREPGLLLTGDRAELDQKSGIATIESASYLLHETSIRGSAESISRGEDKSLVLKQGSLTRCEPDNNTWALVGSEITVDPETNQGIAKHVRMNIKGVPVLYLPYLQFATSSDRQSGFLFPSFSSSDGGGIDVTVPYYFNLAPNYDLTLSPRYLSERGEMLEAEGRHLSEKFETTVSAAYLASDKGGDDQDLEDLIGRGEISREQAYPHKDQDRWLLNIDQSGGFGSPWYSNIDFTAISDIDYFRDMDTASLQVNSTTHLKKSGTLGYKSEHWDYRLKAEEFQSINERAATPYKQLPRLNIDGVYALGGDVALELNHEYANFDHRNKDQDELLTGERVRLDYELSWNKRWSWGFVKPAVKVKSLHYQFDDTHLKAGANDAPSFTAPQASLDSGLIFERSGSLFSNQYLQTFEPRFFYFYSQEENQDELIRITNNNQSVDFDSSELTYSFSQLFRDTRFSGGDRIDDDNRLSVGLTTRFLNPKNGSEYLSASLGQIFYFEDRAIELNRTSAEALADSSNQTDKSQYAGQLSAMLSKNWHWRADILWDPNEGDRINRGSSSLRYRDDSFGIINLNYRYLRKDTITDINDADHDGDNSDQIAQSIEQADLSFSLPIAGNWSVVGRYNHDLTHERELEALFGIEYNSCCYRTRVVVRRWLDNDLIDVIDTLDLEEDQGIFIELQFKSLGGIGTKVSNILYDSIYGYEDRDRNFK